jgi:cytochrome c peroxidase
MRPTRQQIHIRLRNTARASRLGAGGGSAGASRSWFSTAWARLLLPLAVLTALLAAGPARTPPLGLDSYMPVPHSNPLTAEKVALGRKLFFDPILSRDRTVSCATCHDPELGFTDNKRVAEGIGGRKGTRRTPRLINRGYGRSFFWDGRAATLEAQVLEPIENPIEMDMKLSEVTARLSADAAYAAEFKAVFGRAPDVEALRQALASYVRSIVSGDSPYDRFVAGQSDALTPAQRRGLEIFRGKGNCTVCHLGPNLTDEEFHNTGVGWKDGVSADPGRAKVTSAATDSGAFKTPTLREIASTGPYMHDGSLATLNDVIVYYDKGGEPNPHRSREMQRLDLNEREKADLLAFLRALSGEVREGP